jgi:hypothetical protein
MHADTLLCSHPRSGGRWLRYLIAHYLAAHHRLECTVTPQTVFTLVPDHHDEPKRGYPAFKYQHRPDLPLVSVCHQPFSWELQRGYPIVFLARNAYDVVVSAYFHLSREKAAYQGAMRDFLHHPKLGLPAWIHYINSWAPELLTHRDAVHVSYGELATDPARALTRVLEFLSHTPDPALVEAAVESANALRRVRTIRTGQEGNFWDHLQPEEIFEIQEVVHEGLSEFSIHLLQSMDVEVDPFPRSAI